MEKQIQEHKWEGKVSAKLLHADAEKIWSFFQDFFGIHKWFPGATTGYGVHGNNGEPGSVRYVAAEIEIPVKDGEMMRLTSWAKERLVAIDNAQKCLTYEVLDSYFGFNNYVGNIKVVPVENGGGCVIEWWFSVEPVHGLTSKELISKNEAWLSEIAKKMENDALNEK